MSNTMRWRYNDTNPVRLPVDGDTIIEIGDLVYLDTDDAKPASTQADGGSLIANQEALHDAFVGVAMQSSVAGESSPVRIATTGVFEFANDANTFELGDPIGVAENGVGNALENQKVVAVAAPNLAIGRCAKRVESNDTRVLVDVIGTVTKGGVQAAA